MSPGSRPRGRPADTSSPTPAMTSPTTMSSLPNEFAAGEEIPEFEGRGLGRVRTVRRVALDRSPEFLAQRARVCLCRIGRAHQRAPRADGVGCLERQHHDRSRRHEGGEPGKKRPVAVYGVEPFGLLAGEVQALHGTNLEARRFNTLENRARMAGRHSVWFDDG